MACGARSRTASSIQAAPSAVTIFELPGALGAQSVEEATNGGGVVPHLHPDQAPGLVIDDDREVLVVLSVADLVDSDPTKSCEQIHSLPSFLADNLDDVADRPPRDAHQLADRRPVRMDG